MCVRLRQLQRRVDHANLLWNWTPHTKLSHDSQECISLNCSFCLHDTSGIDHVGDWFPADWARVVALHEQWTNYISQQPSLAHDLLWGRLGTSLITSSQPLMLFLAVFVYDPLTSHIPLHVCDCRTGGALKPSWLSSFRLLWLLLITSSIVFHEILGTQVDKCCENDSNTKVTSLSLSSITVAVLLKFLCIKAPIIVGIPQRP